MKLILINDTDINVYHFSSADSQIIKTRCKAAEKDWTNQMLGFFINTTADHTYAAVTIKGSDGIVESMEYRDIERNTPEFVINDDLLSYLFTKKAYTEVSLDAFEPLLAEILYAPKKARRWEVYAEISKAYPSVH